MLEQDSGQLLQRSNRKQLIKTTRTSVVPSTEHQWHQWSEMSAQRPKILKDNTHPDTVCSPCCHLTTDTQVSAAVPPDYRAASFSRLSASLLLALSRCISYMLFFSEDIFVITKTELAKQFCVCMWGFLCSLGNPIFLVSKGSSTGTWIFSVARLFCCLRKLGSITYRSLATWLNVCK